MWVLRSKVNGKLYSDAKTVFNVVGDRVEVIFDDLNPYIFGREYAAWLTRNVVDLQNVWDMVAEEVVE